MVLNEEYGKMVAYRHPNVKTNRHKITIPPFQSSRNSAGKNPKNKTVHEKPIGNFLSSVPLETLM
jgi:hypothetical protein